jgi:Flp pilus assembly protein TadD
VSDDPVSMVGKSQLMQALFCAGMNRELAYFAEEFLQVAPDDRFAKMALAHAHARNGNTGKALTIADE